MGVRTLISKIVHRRDKECGNSQKVAENEESPRSDDTVQVPAPPNQRASGDSGEALNTTKITGRRKAGTSVHRPSSDRRPQNLEALSSNETHDPPTGLRKPSGEAKRPSSEQVAKPSEHLFFGDGSPAANNVTGHTRSSSASTQKKPSNSANDGNTASTTAAYNPTGNDGSGFPATAMSTSQTSMGYQHLTYSGSVQYDYTGAHGQGAFASAGSHGSSSFGY